jgi:hypothetical protein
MARQKKCKHLSWSTVNYVFTPPVNKSMAAWYAGGSRHEREAYEKNYYGFTVVEQKCDLCGHSEFKTITGDARPQQEQRQ